MPFTSGSRSRYGRRRTGRRGMRRGRGMRRNRVAPYRFTRARQNTDLKTFFFRDSGSILNQAGPLAYAAFTPTDVNQIGQFGLVEPLYKEYKVVWMSVKFIPVGQQGTFDRGVTMTRVDQSGDIAQPVNIFSTINDKSVVVHTSYYKPIKRWVRRPSGYPEWTPIEAPSVDDSWKAIIDIFNQGAATSTGNPLYYYIRTFKVIFRGRTD